MFSWIGLIDEYDIQLNGILAEAVEGFLAPMCFETGIALR
jgi:hypothetical protein